MRAAPPGRGNRDSGRRDERCECGDAPVAPLAPTRIHDHARIQSFNGSNVVLRHRHRVRVLLPSDKLSYYD